MKLSLNLLVLYLMWNLRFLLRFTELLFRSGKSSCGWRNTFPHVYSCNIFERVIESKLEHVLEDKLSQLLSAYNFEATLLNLLEEFRNGLDKRHFASIPSSILICPRPLTACQVINFSLNLRLMDYRLITFKRYSTRVCIRPSFF